MFPESKTAPSKGSTLPSQNPVPLSVIPSLTLSSFTCHTWKICKKNTPFFPSLHPVREKKSNIDALNIFSFTVKCMIAGLGCRRIVVDCFWNI